MKTFKGMTVPANLHAADLSSLRVGKSERSFMWE